MALAIALWSMAVAADEPIEFAPPADLRITNVALGAELQDETGRTTLKLVYQGLPPQPESDEEDEEDEEEHPGEPIATVLCSLTPGMIEQAKIDLVLEANQTYVFDTSGKNTLYISGNYIDQAPSDLPPDDDEILDEDEEGAFRLEDVSSDVEVEADGIDEDEEDAPALLPPPSQPKVRFASAKRPREDEPAAEQQLSKKQRKQLKKLQAEAGAAAAPAPAPEAAKKQEKKQEKQQEKQPEGEGKKKKKSKKNKGDKAKL
ncbi:hypothetical protein PsYK624_112500 [Phanerochaete sordida]|uniref:Nucleoplasmin-like domain-containing protein n=1 Tax=Phanerochaete sordida TaxID=48140 RepID=A0A9P3GHX0_9APHY|nr:hypothetical protein PsYK624_112500 [Phanerochaete sordida]